MIRLSKSQIETFVLCERMWWYHYIAGEPSKETPGTLLGTAMHAIGEGHYTGTIPDVEPGAAALLSRGAELFAGLLPFLPLTHSSLRIEVELSVPREWGFYYGYADLVDLDSRVVYDHKSSGNPKRYGHSIQTLPYDLQANIYAAGAMRQFEWTDCGLQWTYAPTRSGEPFPVSTRVNREHVESQLRLHDATAIKLLASRAIPTAEQALPNAKACGAFGGCSYLDICSYPKRNPLAAALSVGRFQAEGKQSMAIDPSILAKVQEMARSAGVAVPPAPAAQSAPAAPPAGQSPLELAKAALAKAEAEAAAAQAQAEAEAAAAAEPAPAPKAPKAPKANANGATPARGYTLYIGCSPQPGRDGVQPEYYSADMFIRSAAQAAAVANGVAHYKLIDYGKSQAALAFALENLVKDLTGDVVVYPDSSEVRDAMHTLRAFAARVVA